MSVPQIFGIVLEVVAAGIVGILLDRAFGTPVLVIWLVVCLIGLGWLHREELTSLVSKNQSIAVLKETPAPLTPAAPMPPSGPKVTQKLAKTDQGGQIVVEVGPDVDSRYAFETRFILTNHNPSAMTEAGYTCIIQNFDVTKSPLVLNEPVNMVLTAAGPIEDLPSGDSRSLYCDFGPGAGFLIQTIKEPIVVINVSYKYENVETKRGFKFFTRQRPDGTYAWLPGGAGP